MSAFVPQTAAELRADDLRNDAQHYSNAHMIDTHDVDSDAIRVSYANKPVAVLVSDLSGFTSTTRKYGILHFASIILRMRQLCLPILHRHNAVYITTEADNFICIFEDALEATMAALEMQAVIKAYQTSLSQDRDHFKIKLNGVGIDFGYGVVVDNEGKLHGKVANTAYETGEDICEKASILVTPSVKNVVGSHPNFVSTSFVPVDGHDVLRVEGQVAGLRYDLVPTTDLTYLDPLMAPLVARHAPDADLNKLDTQLRAHFMAEKSVMMFKLNLEDVAAEYGAHESLELKFAACGLIFPILRKYNGEPDKVSEELWVFPRGVDAIQAAVHAKDAILEYNKTHDTLKQRVSVTGFGIDTGEVLFIHETDIFFGDPVNTSSKLGQDLATDMQILITPKVHEQFTEVKHHDAFKQSVTFRETLLECSNVEFRCFEVGQSGVLMNSRGPATPAAVGLDANTTAQPRLATAMVGATPLKKKPSPALIEWYAREFALLQKTGMP